MKKSILILIAITGSMLLSFYMMSDEGPSYKKKNSNQEIIVLLHGLGRSNSAMWRLAGRLEDAGYDVHQVGYSSINTTLEEIIKGITQQINECCTSEPRSVHFIGHSLGGLLVHSYLQNNRIDHLGRVVLIGTPNKGADIADRFKGNCLIELLVPTVSALGIDNKSLPNKLEAPYYPVGVIAGVSNSDNEDYLPGRDDGLVTVESTRLEGMTDFIEIKSGHSIMRYNKDVANQVLKFLKQGVFSHN